ncbi:MAG: protein kinase [bacterium]|nr:protein kinase [bacterium]
MKVVLDVIEGPESGRVFVFEQADTFLIGRSKKAHLRLDPEADPFISRAHCVVEIRSPDCVVRDLESTNGTFVNGRRTDWHKLQDGDEVRVGRTKIRMSMSGLPLDGALLDPTIGVSETVTNEDPIASIPAAVFRQPGAVRLAAPDPLAGSPDGKSAMTDVVCSTCGCDLSRWADSDGRAREFPEARYLCPSCAEAVKSRHLDLPQVGQYRLLEEVGRGGMGVVYRAVQGPTRRVCAVKRILPEVAKDERSVRLFDREVGVQSMVVHPNLVRVLERGRDGPACYFALEYLDGGDVGQLVKRRSKGPVRPGLAVGIVLQLLEGLSALHDHGFVHRDLKPANFLLGRWQGKEIPTAKISDYGLAKSFEEAGNSVYDYTNLGEAAGSFLFMPPEQILNFRFVGPSADLYAVGVSLYYMLSARYSLPFPAPDQTQRVGAHAKSGNNPIEVVLEAEPIPIQRRLPTLTTPFARMVDVAVAKEERDRFRSAREFADKLRTVAEAEGIV